MVAFLVDQSADSKGENGVSHRKQVELQRGDLIVDDHKAEVLDVNVNRIAEEKALHHGGQDVNGIKDGRHIHQKHGEHAPKVLHISEEDEQRGKDKSDAQIEYNERNYGNNKQKKGEGEAYPIENAEDKEHHQGKAEIDERGNVPRKEEEVFRHVDLCEYG